MLRKRLFPAYRYVLASVRRSRRGEIGLRDGLGAYEARYGGKSCIWKVFAYWRFNPFRLIALFAINIGGDGLL